MIEGMVQTRPLESCAFQRTATEGKEAKEARQGREDSEEAHNGSK